MTESGERTRELSWEWKADFIEFEMHEGFRLIIEFKCVVWMKVKWIGWGFKCG